MQAQKIELLMADIYGYDPLAKILIGRWKIKPIGFALIIFFWEMVFLILLPAIFGYLLPANDIVRNSLSDSYNQIIFLLIFPTVAYYYIAQPKIVIRVYNLVSRSIPALGKRAFLMNDYVRIQHAKKYWIVPGILFATLGIALGISDNISKLGAYWYAANWLMIVLMQLTRGILFYILITVAVRHLVTSMGLNKIFKQTEYLFMLTSIKQNTVFQAVNNYAFSFASIVAVAGLSLGLQPVLSNPPIPEYYIFVAVYFILAPVSFFLPVWQVHEEMANSKCNVLDDLNIKLQSEFKDLLESFNKKDVTATKKSEVISIRVKLIREAIDMAEKCPKWPFNVTVIYKLAVTVASPFFLAIVNRIAEFGNQVIDSIIG